MRKRLATVTVLAAGLLGFPGAASAGDRAVMSTFSHWATTFAIDADLQVRASAHRASGARLKVATQRLRRDALQARRALRTRRASTEQGQQVKTLAIRAFGAYALAEQELLLHMDASAHKHSMAATAHLLRAKRLVLRGGLLLQRAGRLTG
jgi:hypothetical protein